MERAAGSDCERPSRVSVLCRRVERKRSRRARIDRVAAGAGVDQQRPAGHGQRHRQRVGVGVAAVQVAVRPGVEHQVSPRAACGDE